MSQITSLSFLSKSNGFVQVISPATTIEPAESYIPLVKTSHATRAFLSVSKT